MYQHFLQHCGISFPAVIRSSNHVKGKKTSETMEGFYSVISATGFSRTDTGKYEVKNCTCSAICKLN
jgi:hypothetical protein